MHAPLSRRLRGEIDSLCMHMCGIKEEGGERGGGGGGGDETRGTLKDQLGNSGVAEGAIMVLAWSKQRSQAGGAVNT